MMHEFLAANRSDLIARCRLKVALRAPLGIREKELSNGVSVFLEQLIRTLQLEESAYPLRSRQVSGPAGGGSRTVSEIGESATLHGKELMQQGFAIDEVVHDYGDLCQAISDLAVETGAPISADEFRTLNRCLDNAIASAVTEFGYQRDFTIAAQQKVELNERLGFLAHELRNELSTASLAFYAIKTGRVGLGGATGGVLERALGSLADLISRSLAEVRMTAGMPAHYSLISLASFISEIAVKASFEAKMRGCTLKVLRVDGALAIEVDRELLLSAVSNLLQNAFKFSRPGSEIMLSAYAVAERILIDVEDRCGGLTPGLDEWMFVPFTQDGDDKSGLGLGLSIVRRSVEANGGVVSVRNLPGLGCVFTISLPRHLWTGHQPTSEFHGGSRPASTISSD